MKYQLMQEFLGNLSSQLRQLVTQLDSISLMAQVKLNQTNSLTFLNLFKPIQASPNLSKPIQTYPNLPRPNLT
jgi:hypothetical protein